MTSRSKNRYPQCAHCRGAGRARVAPGQFWSDWRGPGDEHGSVLRVLKCRIGDAVVEHARYPENGTFRVSYTELMTRFRRIA